MMGATIERTQYQSVPNEIKDALIEDLRKLVQPVDNQYTKIQIGCETPNQVFLLIGIFLIQIRSKSAFNRNLRFKIFKMTNRNFCLVNEFVLTPTRDDDGRVDFQTRLHLEACLILQKCLRGENVLVHEMKFTGTIPFSLRDIPLFIVKKLVLDKNRVCHGLLSNMKSVEEVEMELSKDNVDLLKHPLIQNAKLLLLKGLDASDKLHLVKTKFTTFDDYYSFEDVEKVCDSWKSQQLPIGMKIQFLQSPLDFKMGVGYSMTYVSKEGNQAVRVSKCDDKIQVEVVSFKQVYCLWTHYLEKMHESAEIPFINVNTVSIFP